jgi:hypothetical protein
MVRASLQQLLIALRFNNFKCALSGSATMVGFDPKRYSSKAPLLRSVKSLPKKSSHGSHANSMRVFEHARHRVEVETIYRVKIDGKIVRIPLTVGADGRVSCHSIPNYATASALDMIKAVIDQFPEDFAKKKSRKGTSRGRHPQEHHH